MVLHVSMTVARAEVVGVTGWREVGTVPALVTVKAYASVPGMKDSFPSEATYSVPPQVPPHPLSCP